MSLRTAFLAATISVLSIGCAATPEDPGTKQAPPTTVAAEGLTVLKAGETSLSIAYRKNNVVIYLQTVRGKATPSVYQNDPNFPKYEMDARFMSDDGHYFWIQRGGDDFVDPTWVEDFARASDLPEPKVSNRLLFEMAAEATQLLPTVIETQLDPVQVKALAPEINTFAKLGTRAIDTYLNHRTQAVDLLKAKGIELAREIPYGTGGPESESIQNDATAYYMDVYNQTIYGVGKHSATRTWRWNGASWASFTDMCNHGDCPGNMSWVCRTTGSYLWKDAWSLHTCRTGYSWTSNDGHNCHDDTRVQQAAFAQNRYNNGWEQWCNNGDHRTDISSWPGDESGSPNCSATDNTKGYAY